MLASRASIERAALTLAVDRLAVEVLSSFRRRGITALLLKGSTLNWLYPGEIRVYTDVDVLVDPRQAAEAGAVLEQLGYRWWHRRRAAPGGHATVWHRADRTFGTVDLHTSLPLVDVPHPEVWAHVCDRVQEHELLSTTVHTLDLPLQLLLVALHAAHHGRDGHKPIEDLRRAVTAADRASWRRAAENARSLAALPAFVAGLRMTSEGPRLLRRLGLDEVATGSQLQATTQGSKAVRLAVSLRQRSWPGRVRWAFDTLFPPVEFVRLHEHDPASRGGNAVPVLYARRANRFLHRLPAFVRDVRAWRRRRSR